MALEYYDNTTTSEFFEQWFVDSLLPVVPKGYTIIMDNASFHRKTRLFELAALAGVRLLFLPPYSPDFNPIEHLWANMKRWLADHSQKFVDLACAIHEFLFACLPQF